MDRMRHNRIGILSGIAAFGLGGLFAMLVNFFPDGESGNRSKFIIQRTEHDNKKDDLAVDGEKRLGTEGNKDARNRVVTEDDTMVSVDHFFLERASIDLFATGSFKLRDEISSLFGLTADETTFVNHEVHLLFEDLRKIEANQAKVILNNKGEEQIEIPPSPEISFRTGEFVERLKLNLAAVSKAEELSKILIHNKDMFAGEFTQRISIVEHPGEGSTRSDFLERVIIDRYGQTVRNSSIELAGSPEIEQFYRPIFSAVENRQQ